MRNLTIHRTKSFVACLATMKVYIEDPNVCDLVINGLPCRKLGTLKNGETKTFEIEDNFAKLFVIIDRFSKGYCNEFYNIPAGTEDIELSGKNEFNLTTGNAFRFDGVTLRCCSSTAQRRREYPMQRRCSCSQAEIS